MKKIESCTAELVKAIQESSEYQELCRPEENRMWTGAAIQDQLCMREMESGICIIQRRILQTQDTGKTGDQYSVLHMRRA